MILLLMIIFCLFVVICIIYILKVLIDNHLEHSYWSSNVEILFFEIIIGFGVFFRTLGRIHNENKDLEKREYNILNIAKFYFWRFLMGFNCLNFLSIDIDFLTINF